MKITNKMSEIREITMEDITPAPVDGLAEKMKNGIVTFAFKKKDGTIRCANGTLMVEYFNYIPSGPKVERKGVTTYFDMDRDCFRSFVTDNFLGYVK